MEALSKLNNSQESEKLIIIENVRNEAKTRKWVFPIVIVSFLSLRFFLKPFPYYYHSLAFCLLMLSVIFPTLKYIEKHPDFSVRRVQQVLACCFVLEMVLIFILFYLFLPIAIYYIRGGVFFAIPFLSIYLITTYPVIRSKAYNIFFCFLSFLVLVFIGILEYNRIFLFYPNYPMREYMFPSSSTILISVILGGGIFFIITNKLNYFWGLLNKVNLQLRKLNAELEERVKKRTKELEKAKGALEVEVKARTKQLSEAAEDLEEQVKQRTKELQGKIEEMEKFQKLVVGRELKMIELKKEIGRLKEELKNYKTNL